MSTDYDAVAEEYKRSKLAPWRTYLDGPAGAFEQDVAFSSTVFRRRNILRANACSNAAAPRAGSVGRRFMPPRTASSIL